MFFQHPPYPYKVLALALYFSALNATASPPGHAPDRAVWFWQKAGSPVSSTLIVGNANLEDQMISRLQQWGITTVYGAYGKSITQNPQAIKHWNRKLALHGIESFILFSDTEAFLPSENETGKSQILKNVVAFNEAANHEERFVGVAFDVEPHIFTGNAQRASWKEATPAVRREYLEGLTDFLQMAREALNQHGQSSIKMEATLPTWYGSLQGRIAWKDAKDRDAWFLRLSQTCDRLSIMDFEIRPIDKIIQRANLEKSLLHGHARIALRANLGEEWSTLSDFWHAVSEVESQTGSSVEIQSYQLLVENQPPKR